MLQTIRNNRAFQYVLGITIGFCFGFLLQRGGVTYYEVIMKQLLLEDFTVIKIILTAIVTGMVGVYAMHGAGLVDLHKKEGSLGASIPGPLLFGIGFALLGYCPGTSVGAVGHGAFDALLGGVIGITFGAGLYAALYPKIKEHILPVGFFGDKTLIELFKVSNPWLVIVPVAIMIIGFLVFLELLGY